MRLRNTAVILLAAAALAWAGCATPQKMNLVKVGMSRAQVVQALGPPFTTAGEGRSLVLFYRLSPALSLLNPEDEYFVRLVEGKVESFGPRY